MASLGGVGVLLLPLPRAQGMDAFSSFSSFSFLFRLGMVDKQSTSWKGAPAMKRVNVPVKEGKGKKRLTCICTPACDNAGQLGRREGGPDVDCFLCL